MAEEKKGRGRPAHKYSHEIAEEVRWHAVVGHPKTLACSAIGITDKTLDKYYSEEWTTARAVATRRIAETLFDAAISGDVGACIFWLKCQAKWSTVEKVEHSVIELDAKVDVPPRETREQWEARTQKRLVAVVGGKGE